MNVLSEASMRDFAEAVEKVIADPNVKGAVLTSGKPAFMAGADLSMMEGQASGSGAPKTQLERAQALYEHNLKFQNLLRRVETSGKPFAAAINGTALGGGLEVTLACHYRVAADDPKIQLGLPESKVGLLPGGGGTQRLPRLIGAQAALPLMLEGKSVTPQKALELKFVNQIAPREQIVAEAKKWVREVGKAEQPWDEKNFRMPGGTPHQNASNSGFFTVANATVHKNTYGLYPAQQYILSCVYEGIQVPIDAGLRIETRYFTKLLMDPTSRNMVRSMFLSMQELNKLARRPKGVPEFKVRKMGVLGAGMMGAAIAHVSARAGIEVVLIDQDQAAADKGRAHAEKMLAKDVERGSLPADQRDAILNRIVPTTDYAKLSDADLVIEAVFEDRAIKADVTKKAEAVLPEHALFGSNTSTLPITGLAQASKRPGSFIGVHFFSPVERMQLVEIIRGKETSDEALAKAMDYVKAIRKTPIVVNDSRGFYTSRVFATYINEGIHMLAEGAIPALIENCGKMTGMPVAPLALTDEVALDLVYKIRKQTQADMGDSYEETAADRIVAEMVEKHGRVGKKAGKGFYDYPKEPGGRKRLWPDLANIAKQSADQPSPDDLKTRFLTIQALETARCVEENVVTDPREADVGAILGWGFAPWTGGPLSYIDTLGAAAFVAQCEALAQKHGKRFMPNQLLRDMAAKGESFYKRFAPQKQAA
jgi:3-hydroxyacyl-CoA dehydrogenase/enoyl-CoA hydratase/3-hydroxybutyryl-CoA epimerase